MRHRGAPLPTASASDLFMRICGSSEAGCPTLGEVARFAGPQAYALLLLLFALPEALPLPVVGMSTIIAIPLILLSAQMAICGSAPRLPQWLERRTIPLRLLHAAGARLAAVLRRLEGVSRPRWGVVAGSTRLIGAACLVLAVIIALPIPFGNLLPALCIVGLAVGMLQRDGLMVAIALAAGAVVAVGFSTALILAGSTVLAVFAIAAG
jgi:hypothetical protein